MLSLLMLGMRSSSTVYFDMALLLDTVWLRQLDRAREVPAARRGHRAMTGTELPLWAALPAALLLIAGGLLTLTAAIGRCGCPTSIRAFTLPMRATLGTGCVLLASMLVSSTLMQRPVAHELLITLFIVMTTPVTVICSCAPPYS
jgi:multicomponent K+:H+ antiporter subunit G